jgi:flavin-dependent thymidylate synthase
VTFYLSNSDFEDGDFYNPERIMEFAGRGDYGESNQRKLGELVKVVHGDKGAGTGTEAKVPILQKYLGMGHQSMIEFGWAAFYFEFSRTVLAELTRHRLASYQVESQRFVKYDDITRENIGEYFYLPDVGYPMDDEGMIPHYEASLTLYQNLRKSGVSPQDARYVLPNAFKTRMCMAANVREWRHILTLRLDKSAQPEMRELMAQVYDQLVMVFPNALHGVTDGGRGIR